MRLALRQFGLLNTQRRVCQRTCRGFATSSPAQFEILGPIAITAQLIRGIRDVTDIPYGLSIPLTAVVLRSIVTLPLAIYSQKKLARRIELRPLIFQWTHLFGSVVAAKYTAKKGHLPSEGKKISEQINKEAYRIVRRKSHVLYKRNKCSLYHILLPQFVQLPLFILVSLALRSMTGWAGWSDVGMVAAMDPRLYVEGFQHILDLTKPDPAAILPVSIGLLSVINGEITRARRGKAIATEGSAPSSRISNVLYVAGLMISAAMIPIAMQAPAAITLYWFASVTFTLVQNILIAKYHPLPPLFRPLSYKPASTIKQDLAIR